MNYLDFPNDKFEIKFSATSDALASGEIIRFMYDGEAKSALVLVGNWKGKMHALSLREELSEHSLRTLLRELATNTSDAIGLRSTYEDSRFTKQKSYRTYTPSKISELKTIKLAPPKPSPTPKVKEKPKMLERPIETKRYSMYEE